MNIRPGARGRGAAGGDAASAPFLFLFFFQGFCFFGFVPRTLPSRESMHMTSGAGPMLRTVAAPARRDEAVEGSLLVRAEVEARGVQVGRLEEESARWQARNSQLLAKVPLVFAVRHA